MKNKKLIFLFIGVTAMLLLAAAFMIYSFSNPENNQIVGAVFWPGWITGFCGMIGYYFKTNVRQKEIISQNYNAALDDNVKER